LKKLKKSDFWVFQKVEKIEQFSNHEKNWCKNVFFCVFIFPTFRSNKLFWKIYFCRKLSTFEQKLGHFLVIFWRAEKNT